MHARRPTGFAAFTVIWLGQVTSVLGTRMTNFVLGITLWQQTGEATSLALMTVLAFGATMLLSPLAGSLVDRVGRRTTLVVSDIGCAVATATLLAVLLTGEAGPWMFYLTNTLTGAFLAFQGPAYATVITHMMSKEHYSRANAMVSLSTSVPAIFAPTLAAVLLTVVSPEAVLIMDVGTYVFAIAVVFLVAIPERTPSTDEQEAKRGSVWQDTLTGFRYLVSRPALRRLEGISFMVSLLAAMGWILLLPMIMARSGGSEAQVGIVQSLGAIGGVLGGVLLTALKSPARKMVYVLAATLVFHLVGRVLLGVGDSVLLWSAAWFCAWLSIPFIEGYILAILQEKVEHSVQGRVFAARQMLETLSMPLAVGVAAPLADHYLERQMMPDGTLAPIFGFAVGTGPGAGMALVMVVTGVIGTAVAILGLCSKPVRDLESLLPDQTPDPVAAKV